MGRERTLATAITTEPAAPIKSVGIIRMEINTNGKAIAAIGTKASDQKNIDRSPYVMAHIKPAAGNAPNINRNAHNGLIVEALMARQLVQRWASLAASQRRSACNVRIIEQSSAGRGSAFISTFSGELMVIVPI